MTETKTSPESAIAKLFLVTTTVLAISIGFAYALPSHSNLKAWRQSLRGVQTSPSVPACTSSVLLGRCPGIRRLVKSAPDSLSCGKNNFPKCVTGVMLPFQKRYNNSAFAQQSLSPLLVPVAVGALGESQK